MKNIIPAIILAIAPSFAANAEVNVTFPATFNSQSVKVAHQKICDIVGAQENIIRMNDIIEDISISNHKGLINLNEDMPARYNIEFGNGETATFYASPDDELAVNIKSISPLIYTVSGSELMEGWTEFENQARPILNVTKALALLNHPDPQQVEQYNADLSRLVRDYISTRPDASSSVAVLMCLDGKDFMDLFTDLTPRAKESIIYPLAKEHYLSELIHSRQPVENELAEEIEL